MGRSRLADYSRLTELYLEAMDLGLPPVKTIAEILGITHKAAERRVHRLRTFDYLPTGDPLLGRATRDPHRSLLPMAIAKDSYLNDPRQVARRLSPQVRAEGLAFLDKKVAEWSMAKAKPMPTRRTPRQPPSPPVLTDWFPAMG